MCSIGFYGISTIVGYLVLNPLYTYILNVYDLVWLGFHGISTIVGYLELNRHYTYIYQMYMICVVVLFGKVFLFPTMLAHY